MALWAFVSDIHGNRRALDRVEEVAARRGVTEFVCLGDVVGRGDPAGCVTWVDTHAAIALAGNRDLDHVAMLPAELQEVVSSWPREAQAADFLVTHGDPGGHRILRSDREKQDFRGVADCLDASAACIWLYGHTHYPRLWRLGAPPTLCAQRIDLEPGQRYVVNVGTVGRPFPGKGGPAMTLYDDGDRWIEMVSLPR